MPHTKRWMKKKLSKTIPPFLGSSGVPTYETFSQWRVFYLKGTDNDRWQEYEQAIKYYEQLVNVIERFLQNGETIGNEEIYIGDKQKATASKISFCISCRMTAIQNSPEKHWMTLDELNKLKPIFKNFFAWEGVFPVLLREESNRSKISLMSQDSGLSELLSSDDENSNENNGDSNYNNGSLLPKLPMKAGLTRLTIKIFKFGLRHPGKIKDPYVVATLRDKDSVNLTAAVQISKVASKIEDYHAFFDTRIEVQRYVEKIPKGSALFFELKVPDNRQTKYYAYLKREDFVEGKGYLEIYKGPVDYHRKKCIKVTQKKPLYLHIEMTLKE